MSLLCEALDLRSDVENVTARLRYLGEAHQTVKGDIALTKRATEKASVDVTKAQEEKLQQVGFLIFSFVQVYMYMYMYKCTCM